VRVAALYDVHGNAPALDAVLAEVDGDGIDRIVFGGDLFWGPWPAEVLERVLALGDRALFVRGNTERETFAPDPDDRWTESAHWVAARLGEEALARGAGWPTTVELTVEALGRVCFCHATPRSDDEIVTPRSPEAVLADALGGTDAAIVVCGHTHVQFDLEAGGRRLVNAGSVGFPYEERPGAYWLELGPDVRHRRTDYDIASAAKALDEVAWPGPFSGSGLLEPASPEDAIARFESRRAEAAADEHSS
jgi:predicted phosphodiesterase